MQEAADRVDSSLRETRAARGEGNLPLRRGVLVAIDGGGQSEYLVRVARRIAERRDAPWTVVTVQGRRQDEPRGARSMRPSPWRVAWVATPSCCMDRALPMPCSTTPRTTACRPWCWADP